MSHEDCTHPATKAGRAKCRRDRLKIARDNEAAADRLRAKIATLVDSYYSCEGDSEEIVSSLAILIPEVHEAYYYGEASAEEAVAIARRHS